MYPTLACSSDADRMSWPRFQTEFAPTHFADTTPGGDPRTHDGFFGRVVDTDTSSVHLALAEWADKDKETLHVVIRTVSCGLRTQTVATSTLKRNLGAMFSELALSQREFEEDRVQYLRFKASFADGVWRRSVADARKTYMLQDLFSDFGAKSSLESRKIIPLPSTRLFEGTKDVRQTPLLWRALASAFDVGHSAGSGIRDGAVELVGASCLTPLCRLFSAICKDEGRHVLINNKGIRSAYRTWTEVLAMTDALHLLCPIENTLLNEVIAHVIPCRFHKKFFAPDFMLQSTYLRLVAQYVVRSAPRVAPEVLHEAIGELMTRVQSSGSRGSEIDLLATMLRECGSIKQTAHADSKIKNPNEVLSHSNIAKSVSAVISSSMPKSGLSMNSPDLHIV